MSVKSKFSNHPLFNGSAPVNKPVIEEVKAKAKPVFIKPFNAYDIPSSIAEYVKAHKELVTRPAELSVRLSELDKLVLDLKHYIELESSSSVVMKLAFKLKSSLIERRAIKDELGFLDSVTQAMNICKDCDKLEKLVGSRVGSLNHRTYQPRAKTLEEIINE